MPPKGRGKTQGKTQQPGTGRKVKKRHILSDMPDDPPNSDEELEQELPLAFGKNID